MANISVNFKISGNELSNYISVIQKKSDDLTASAVRGATEQANKGKEQLKIIQDIIAATERKNRVESQAARSITLEQRESLIRSSQESNAAYKNKNEADYRAGKIRHPLRPPGMRMLMHF